MTRCGNFKEHMPHIINLQDVKDKLSGSISCCIIAKDEEAFIAGAIASVRELVSEVIVVDTGSSDRTACEAKRCGARVYTFPWDNDFAAARNYAIGRASKEWILVLDADEAIAGEDHERIRNLVVDHPDCAFAFVVRTYSDSSRAFGWNAIENAGSMERGALGYVTDRCLRLFRNDRETHYRGAVHECAEASLGARGVSIIDTDIIIHHYGRLDASERIWRKSLVCVEYEWTEPVTNTGSAWYIYETAAQLLHLGALEKAQQHALKGLEIEPRNWELLNVLGLAHMKRKRYGEAELALQAAIERSGGNEELYNNLGVVFLETGKFSAALDSFERGMDLSVLNEKLFRNAAIACLAMDDIIQATIYITRSLELDPFVPHSQAISAEIHYRNGDNAEAAEVLGRMKFLGGTQLKVYFKVMHIYILMNMPEAAEEVLLRAASDHPVQDGLTYLFGKLNEMKGDEEKAVSVYKRLLARLPEHVDALCSLGCIYERRGELERALSNFLKARRLAPGNPQVAVNCGIIMGRLGMNDEAERDLRDVIGKKDDYGAAHNALGWHLANQKRYLDALPHFRRAVELEPENVQFYVNLGLAFEKMNRYEEAVGVYERAAFLSAHRDPKTRTILEQIGEPVS